MPWARAVIHCQIGAALLDFWNLSPLEVDVLARASNRELTEKEEAAKEADAQKQMSAALAAAIGRPIKPTA